MDNVNVITLAENQLKEMLEKAAKMGADKALTEFEDVIGEQYFDFDQVANYLKVEISTIKKYLRVNALPYYKKSGRAFFKKSEIAEWIDSGRVKTDCELQSEGDQLIHSKNAVEQCPPLT